MSIDFARTLSATLKVMLARKSAIGTDQMEGAPTKTYSPAAAVRNAIALHRLRGLSYELQAQQARQIGALRARIRRRRSDRRSALVGRGPTTICIVAHETHGDCDSRALMGL